MNFTNKHHEFQTYTIDKISFVLLIVMLCIGQVYGQKSVETITKEVSFKNNATENMFVARNIHGSIDVEAYSGTTIKIEIKKTITANSQAGLEKGKKEFKINIVETAHKIIVHPDAPYICFDAEYHGMNVNRGSYGNKVPYNAELSYIIKVPRNISIDVSTINDGDVAVNDVQAQIIKAGNINGSIALNNVSGATEAHTINGTIDVTYAKNPVKKSSYSTINGDITINYLKNLTADVAFESMHGDLYTDFTISEYITGGKKNRTNKKRGVKYRYTSKPLVRIGNGGTRLDFKTLNGDVSIKKL